ncbi:epoxide hydrolase family protein [Nonomuraea soli]|uniref:Pimeloyl-ACP methyl ester carboxylesterase n=1 Tax=Nonomuraea soli TaxID=1032476 RepID=A0A7W0HR37_9ACTN|nr:epoxide hydrolase [Nonomuraea soli]MBA2892599.1 pimeloyl-ACP methyl ester carboxylesterase [Nonomuraea soli]
MPPPASGAPTPSGPGSPGATGSSPGSPEGLEPIRIQAAQADLDDLRDRLRRTRWPDEEPVGDWSQGVPLSYLRELCRYWAEEYDWRAVEARLNALPQFRTRIDGVGIHVMHARSRHPEAMPLIMTHGWPGSVLEFLDVIGPLTDPPDPRDAFHVICPSLPGYGFSDRPAHTGWTVHRIAEAWATLMDRLGYDTYGAQGHDWGTTISTLLAKKHPERLAGIHLVPPLAAPLAAPLHDDLTAAERTALADLEHAAQWESGYSGQMATRPQTLGYGLTDSPAGLCAWIVEKFHAWSDGMPFSRDRLLDNVTLYWLTGTAASSARLYWESIREVSSWFTTATTDRITVPTGGSIFPREVPRPSRRWAARRYADLRYWNELDKGGHFAAMEQPEVFVEEVRAFFRLVRL